MSCKYQTMLADKKEELRILDQRVRVANACLYMLTNCRVDLAIVCPFCKAEIDLFYVDDAADTIKLHIYDNDLFQVLKDTRFDPKQ